ncbi:MAG: metallophosphoesterase [Clostridia bacterium]|nr:metallophosphoesterase [Clostridia bacterium]
MDEKRDVKRFCAEEALGGFGGVSRVENVPPTRSFRRGKAWFPPLFFLLYWVIMLTVILTYRDLVAHPAGLLLLAAGVFLLSVTLYHMREPRDAAAYIRAAKKVFVIALLLSGAIACLLSMGKDAYYLLSYINSVAAVSHAELPITYEEETGIYRFVLSGEEFKILHLTDIHLGGSLFSRKKDLLALRACYAEILHARPDLVIVTGDLCFPMGVMSLSFNNSAPVYQFAAFMRKVGIPWAFTFGNHDAESFAVTKNDALCAIYRSLSYKTSGNLLYPYVQPNVTGRNNQLIEVRNADGSLRTALFLLDSNAYTGEGFNAYDYIHDDQVAWYASEVERLREEAGEQISSLVFFHIPLREYATAYALYKAGSDEVVYYFGKENDAVFHEVSCSHHESSLFDTMVTLGSTTGVFCGHDHYNNYSIEYKGIRLTYGMSIDYLAMPGISRRTEQRGAELITLYPDRKWEVRQIPLTAVMG